MLDHIRWLNGPVRDVLSQRLGEGIGLLCLDAQGVAGGGRLSRADISGTCGSDVETERTHA
ncbi:MAG: hypothetical protein AB8B62_19000 [Roseobacter sp.]